MDNNLTKAIAYLEAYFVWQLSALSAPHIEPPLLPSFLSDEKSIFTDFLTQVQLDNLECLYLTLSLIPHLQPDFLDNIICKYSPKGGVFPEFGGVRGTNHRGLLPTGETALFILAGKDLEKRLILYELFSIYTGDSTFKKGHQDL